MKIASLVLTALLFLGALAQAEDIQQLAWLAGCWAAIDSEDGSGEQWTKPAGGTMLGASRTVKNGKTVATEFIQIRRNEKSGKLEYVARPHNQEGASFSAVKMTDRMVIFENPEHDFPQRIVYELNPEGQLDARIEGTWKGEFRTEPFPMKKTSCP